VGRRHADLVYATERDWNAYERTKPTTLTGVVKTTRFNREKYVVVTLDVDRRTWTIVLARLVPMEFRGLTEDMLKPGASVSVDGFVNERTADEFRAEIIKVGSRSFDVR
jgi:hypothetical protein